MLRRHFIFPILATLILTISLSFLSCASQERNDAENESEWNDSEEVADNDTADDSASADTGSDEEVSASNEEASGEKSEDTMSELESTVSEDKQDELTAETKPEEAPAPTETAKAESTEESLENLEPNEDLAPKAEETVAAATPAEGEAPAATNEELSADELAPDAETAANTPAPEAPAEPPAFETAPTLDTASTPPSPKPRRVRSARNTVPTIPEKAFEKGGYNLNRFYFLREGDTRENVSELLYGTPKNAGELGKVNKGKPWRAGTLIYYVSPTDPKDQSMRSFYQERNVPPQEVTIGRGDWLSSIAKAKLGSPHSWKEIAVVNGMDSPDNLTSGQRLAIYPKNLTPYSKEALAAAQKKEEETRVAEAAPPPPPKPVEAVAPPPEPVAPPPPPPPAPPVAKKEKPQPDSLNVSKLIEQNLFAVAVGGVILLLGIALMALNRKKSRRDDFGEDGFSAPPKARRK